MGLDEPTSGPPLGQPDEEHESTVYEGSVDESTVYEGTVYEATFYEEHTYYEPCQEAIATLYTFLDGELTADRRARIQRHLDECSPCFAAFGFEAELKAVVARKCRDEVPDSLRRRVAEALRAEDVTF
ncbi:MAG TPA: mycothiol system anti-sigma-R factor [Acidimicrobiales bacterium]|nr:mycothiol system anti-sigma-R factor [Acidimicrobiales bacterium]